MSLPAISQLASSTVSFLRLRISMSKRPGVLQWVILTVSGNLGEYDKNNLK